MPFPGRAKTYCFTPLINRLQNCSLKLCLKCVLLTGMSDVFIISSVTLTACLYYSKKKWFSLENSNGSINGKLHISYHLSSGPRCQDQNTEARELWEEKEQNRDLKSIHTLAEGSCSGQGQTFIRRHCPEPNLCESLPCRAYKSDASPRGDPLWATAATFYMHQLKEENHVFTPICIFSESVGYRIYFKECIWACVYASV